MDRRVKYARARRLPATASASGDPSGTPRTVKAEVYLRAFRTYNGKGLRV
jgi:hypothetical protein